MTFQNMSNDSRVERIVDALELLGKSAKSNRASKDELHIALSPVLAKLGELGFFAGPEAPEPVHGALLPDTEVKRRIEDRREKQKTTPGERLSLSDYINDASISECSSAIAICMLRIDEALTEAGAFK